MTVHLMNSAMMPREGFYACQRIDKETFCRELTEAHGAGILRSSIGYPENARLILKWTGIRVEINRSETPLESGDVMLVMKLTYRIRDPRIKGAVNERRFNSEDDFEFFRVSYSRREVRMT